MFVLAEVGKPACIHFALLIFPLGLPAGTGRRFILDEHVQAVPRGGVLRTVGECSLLGSQ
jgi:hypothetical protein